MSEPQHVEATPVYYHDCPVMGPHTLVPQAILLTVGGEFLLGTHHKCPMCSATAGELEIAPGVEHLGGNSWRVDPTKATRVS